MNRVPDESAKAACIAHIVPEQSAAVHAEDVLLRIPSKCAQCLIPMVIKRGSGLVYHKQPVDSPPVAAHIRCAAAPPPCINHVELSVRAINIGPIMSLRI